MKFTGLASRTETPYDMGFYVETIARGAFKKTLSEKPDVVLNIQHGAAGSGLPIARTKAGNMTLTEDNEGLQVDAELDPLDPDVQLVARKMGNGNLDGQMSFCFAADSQSWSKDYSERRITVCNLHRGDVSIVVQGASPSTTSTLRNFRVAVAAAGGRATMRERKELAEVLGQTVILEMRSFVLDGRRYDFESAGAEQRSSRITGDDEHRSPPDRSEERLALPAWDPSADRLRLARLRYPVGHPSRPAA